MNSIDGKNKNSVVKVRAVTWEYLQHGHVNFKRTGRGGGLSSLPGRRK